MFSVPLTIQLNHDFHISFHVSISINCFLANNINNINNVTNMVTEPCDSSELNLDAFVDMLEDMSSQTPLVSRLPEAQHAPSALSQSIKDDIHKSVFAAPELADNKFQSNTLDNKVLNNNADNKCDQSRVGIANITDFSPEWSYPEGGTKVLVTGPWYSTTSPYTVMFDDIPVEAVLVQSGVLRSYCPG